MRARGIMPKKKPVRRRRTKTPKRARAVSLSSVPDDTAPIHARGSPSNYRVRVRMYRQGLGDCFLLTFPRAAKKPFQMLIDCGALDRKADFMTRVVKHIRDTVRDGTEEKARLDVVVATHEHKDHLSGFNQAREVFNNDFEIGAVWLGWTENLTQPEIKKIKETRRRAVAKLQAALASPLAVAAGPSLDGIRGVLGFTQDDDTSGSGKIAEALEYLKLRGKSAGDLQYLEPGAGPLGLEDVNDVRVYVLGPPRDPILLKGSEVTEQLKRDEIVYHLSSTGDAGIDGLAAALSGANNAADAGMDRYHPFSTEHRLSRAVPDALSPSILKPNPYFEGIASFVAETYDDPSQAWRRIDRDWLSAFGQLALDLDSDTNNTSLVLAFEFSRTREVLLFVGDAQVGNWRSWANVEFKVSGLDKPMPALDLLNRTVFYKVGHHCSHNATLKKGGLELMNRDDLIAFIPLDQETAKNQGTKGWEMPAPPLFKALKERTSGRVAISDVKEDLPVDASGAGVVATRLYIDYFLL